MNQILLEVGDAGPVALVRDLLRVILREEFAVSLFFPVWTTGDILPQSRWLASEEEIEHVDPFAPVMGTNHAGEIATRLAQKSDRRPAIFLHPCEVRSLLVLAQEREIDLANALLISADCLAVYNREDLELRISRFEGEAITREGLRFAGKGGILPSRYRSGCQLCNRPYTEDVDLHFQVFGLNTSTSLGVLVRPDRLTELIEGHFSTSAFPESLLQRREAVLSKLASWRGRSIERSANQVDPSFASTDALASHLAGCASCAGRLQEHCPTSPLSQAEPSGDITGSISKWLSSCGGCGMCSYECPYGYPLYEVILLLQRELTKT